MKNLFKLLTAIMLVLMVASCSVPNKLADSNIPNNIKECIHSLDTILPDSTKHQGTNSPNERA